MASDAGSTANHHKGAAVASDGCSRQSRAMRRPSPRRRRRRRLAGRQCLSPAPAVRGPRMALIIGNGAYAHVKALLNLPNDARAVAKSRMGSPQGSIPHLQGWRVYTGSLIS
ncbi:hypothetical protein ABIB85_006246 [Bradyrhizobium sp. JR1.5]